MATLTAADRGADAKGGKNRYLGRVADTSLVHGSAEDFVGEHSAGGVGYIGLAGRDVWERWGTTTLGK